MLAVEHLHVFHGLTEVLRDVSFTVPEGDIFALLGGNGSGKTTLINALSGMLKPRKGSIKLAGEELIGRRSDQVVRAGMVQVPQGREVFASMTVKDNLEMGAATRRGSAEIQADMKDLFAFFPRLLEKKDRMAGALSGGEQQQVAIARALMGRPRVLLMDEPSVGLSPRVVDGMIETIKRLNRERRLTILIAEQNVGVAASVASWAYVLRDGRIALSEPAPKLIGNPQVLSSYLGR